MFAVVFEVHPAPSKMDDYLALAAHLKPLLEVTDGFVSNERFRSRRRDGWILSLSLWRDEKSVVRWRSQGEHHAIQLHGRAAIFADYHLRVGEVTTDSDTHDLDQRRFDETEVGTAKAIGITEWQPVAQTGAQLEAKGIGLDLDDAALVDHDLFDSITKPGKLLLLTSWTTAGGADRWSPPADCGHRHRRIRSIRDYGLFDRREAAQFCPVVRRPADP